MIHIYGPINTRAFRCYWTLEEIGQPYQSHPLNLRLGEHQQDSYLKINPSGKIPSMIDESESDIFVLTESSAICTYISDQYSYGNLIPKIHTKERAKYNQWVNFVVTELEQPLWTIGKHTFALPSNLRVPEVNRTAVYEFDKAIETLEFGLKFQPYILGNNFSTADILIGHTLMWAKLFQVTWESSIIDEYYSRLRKRPSTVKMINMARSSVHPKQ